VLRELNNIAKDLLGLHGYPVQPVAWGEMFGKRVCTAAAKTVAKPSTNVPAMPAGMAHSAAPGRFDTRSHA